MVNIKYIDMPSKVKATHTLNEDGSYTIFLNSKLNYEQQCDGYTHEMKHISNDDFCKYDVDEIECITHGGY